MRYWSRTDKICGATQGSVQLVALDRIEKLAYVVANLSELGLNLFPVL